MQHQQQPTSSLSSNTSSSIYCTPNPVFIPQTYQIPKILQGVLQNQVKNKKVVGKAFFQKQKKLINPFLHIHDSSFSI